MDKRKKSVIMKGLPEDDSTDDSELLNKVLTLIHAKPEKQANFFRIGPKRNDGRARSVLVRVTFDFTVEKQKALDNAKQLATASSEDLPFDPKRVFVGPDLTKLQRERGLF